VSDELVVRGQRGGRGDLDAVIGLQDVLGGVMQMPVANIPAVLIGDHIAEWLPVRAIRIAAAAVFVVLGILAIAGIGS